MMLLITTLSVYETSQGQPNDFDASRSDDASIEVAAQMATEDDATVSATVTEACPTQTNDVQIAVTADLTFTISRFDTIMQKVGAEQGYDWRLMSAIAYNESRFQENLVSKQGAVGIMQIRPVVAKHFNIPVENLSDTETNIRLAGMLLNELDALLKIPATTPEQDRLSIILASYNAGIGHIYDACRLARSEGADPNSWAVISGYLKLMSEPEYYTRDVVKYGKFNGSAQTLGYVREVMQTYNDYCSLAS